MLMTRSDAAEPGQEGATPMRRLSAGARDAGLRRVRSTTKWIAAGAAGLTAVFTVFTLPRPKHVSVTPTLNGVPSHGASSTTSPSQDQGQNSDPGLQAPPQAPSQTYQAPLVQSGGT
jgi:hypothetical protein